MNLAMRITRTWQGQLCLFSEMMMVRVNQPRVVLAWMLVLASDQTTPRWSEDTFEYLWANLFSWVITSVGAHDLSFIILLTNGHYTHHNWTIKELALPNDVRDQIFLTANLLTTF